jgi:CRP-like cAMP-binding protein
MASFGSPQRQKTAQDPLPATANLILAGLPDEEYQRLLPHMEYVALNLKDVLVHPNIPIRHVYFPLTGVTSLVNLDDDGGMFEVGMTGREGIVGFSVLLGQKSIPQQAIVQVSPVAYMRMKAEVFHEEAHRNPVFLSLLLRYVNALFNQVTQASACRSLHSVDERLSRWLLMCHDRIETDRINLTQEFIATMLGVRRPTVSLVAALLHEAGLIQYSRGIITVLDREGLEASSCECYRIIQKNMNGNG